MTVIRKSLLFAAVVFAVLVVGVLWAIGTDSGTRWLVGRTAGYLPEELQLGEVQGSFLGGVTVRSLQWRDETTSMRVQSLFVDVRLLPLLGRHLVVDELEIGNIDLTLADANGSTDETGLPTIDLPLDISIVSASIRQILISTGDLMRTIDEITLVGNLHASDLVVSQFDLRSSWLDLDITGRLVLADRYPSSIDGNWKWKESDLGAFAGQLSIKGDMREYALNHSLATPLAVATSGVLSYESGSVNADLLHEWESLEWPLEQRTLYSSQGTLHVIGNTEAFNLELETNVRADDQPDTRIRMTGNTDLQAIRVSSLEAENLLGRIIASGDVRWLPERVFDLNYSATDLDPSFMLESLAGKIGLEGSVAGVIRDDLPDIDLQIARIDGEINGHPVRGGGSIRIIGPEVSLSDTRLQVGSNAVRVDGNFGRSLSLGAEIEVADIAEVLADATGSIRGQLSLSGSIDHPDVQMDLTGAEFAWREYSLGSFSANANLSAIEQGVADLKLARFTFGNLELDEAQLSASGQLSAHDLRASLRGLDSQLVIEATGGYDEQTWSGQLASLAISNDALDRWVTTEPSQLSVSPDRSLLAQTCLFGSQDTGKVCFGGTLRSGGPASFDVSASGVPISAIPVPLPEDVTLQGFLHANLSGEWVDSELTAKSDIELREAAIDAVYDEESVLVAVSRANGEMTVTDNRVESSLRMELADGTAGGTTQLSIQDFTDSGSSISGRADVTITDASSIAVFVPEIRNPQGRIDGSLTIAGSLSSPEFLGDITLSDGSFGVRQTGIDVSDFNLRLSQLAPGQLRLLGGARSGDGQISIEGRTEIGAGTGIRSEVRISGDNFELARLPDWQLAASPSVTVVFDDRAASVSGELTIPTADINVKEIPESAESPSPDAVVHRQEISPPSPSRRIDIDVRTALGDDVQFAGFGLTTGLEGAVRVRGGTHAVYIGEGRLNLRGGRYKAYGQELEIEQGELIFNGPLENPQLNVRAIRHINSVVAGIALSGTPTQLQSDVFSDPLMSDADTLSYLLTGRPLASATSGGEGDTLNNAAFALGVSSAGSITSQVRTQLGLETLTIEGGVDDSRLIAGKRFGDRLLVEYGYGLIDKLGTLLLRYQLTDRIVLESRTGTVSNLDVLYSVKKE